MSAASSSLRSATNVYSPETFTAADASSLAQLMGSGSLGGLERLDLSGKKLGAEALRPVVDALGDGALPWLRHLNIGGNKLGDGIEQLAAALKAQMPRINCVLGSLESLHTATNELTNDGVIALTSALALGALPWLKVLGLGGNKIDDRAVESLVESGSAGTFKTLEGLGLDNVGITAEGVTTMAAGLRDGAFPSLRRLSLSRLHEQHADIKAAAEERRVHLGFY